MKLQLDARMRWWVLAGAWALLLVLGVTGFIDQAEQLGLDPSVLDHVYFTLQLMALDYAAGSPLNWQLEVARFVAPALAASTILQSASVVFREQFARWRVRFMSGHTVVTGLGPAGVRLARALAQDGRRLVAIDPDPASTGTAAMRELDVPVINGDPRDRAVLQSARVDRATRLVVASPDDALNVAVAASAAQIARAPSAAPLRCSAHLSNAELASLLRASELGGERPIRTEFFNLHERAARVLVDEHPLGGPDGGAPHLMVMGLGQVGRNVVVAAAQQWLESGAGPLRVSLVDRDANGRFQALRLQHPALAAAVEVSCIDVDLGAPTADASIALQAAVQTSPPTLVVSAFEDQSLAWSSGLLVRRLLGTREVDVVVRTESDGGLGILLGEALGAEVRTRIVTFPIFARACTVATVEGGVREHLARAMHEDHVGRAGSGAAWHRHWDELDDEERESSRTAADAVVSRLADIGLELVPLQRWGAPSHEFTLDEIEQLAAGEHARWKVERESAGWTWGATRDDSERKNPLLVDWEDLDDQARTFNREAAAALPSLIARAGFELARS